MGGQVRALAAAAGDVVEDSEADERVKRGFVCHRVRPGWVGQVGKTEARADV